MIQYVACQCDRLVVALNSDEWLIRKKGDFFMDWNERYAIMSALKDVNEVIAFDDDDDSACDAIAQLKIAYPESTIAFYNGGDRTHNNILEILRFEGDPQVKFFFGAGGDYKKSASSELLRRWIDVYHQTAQRNWGYYNVLDNFPGAKVKTLHVYPHHSLSMQKHQYRNEHWFVVDGQATVELHETNHEPNILVLNKHELLTVPVGCWHKLSNNTDLPLNIVEIQYGEKCEESDITRQTR